MKARIWADGACQNNPGICSYGFIIELEDGREFKDSGLIGPGTNNIAEISAIIEAIKRAISLGVTDIKVMSDSQVALGRVFGRERKGLDHIVALQAKAKAVLSRCKSSYGVHCNREHGRIPECDILAQQVIENLPVPDKSYREDDFDRSFRKTISSRHDYD